MFFSIALAHTLSTQPVRIPYTSTEATVIARSYGGRSSSFRPSYSRNSNYSAPTRIRVNSTNVHRVSPPKTINISKPVNSAPVNKLGPRLQKTTLTKLKGSDGIVPINKSAPPKPILVSEPTSTSAKRIISGTQPKNTISAPRATRYYSQTPQQTTPVIIQQDTSFSNPWMWMYLMDNRNQAPSITSNAAKNLDVSNDSVKTKIITKEERNPVKDFLLILLGLGCGIPVGYLIFKEKFNN